MASLTDTAAKELGRQAGLGADNMIERQDSQSGIMRTISVDRLTPPEPPKPAPGTKKVDEKDDQKDALRPVAEMCAEQKVSPEKGLSEPDAVARFKRDGPNELLKPKPPSLAILFLMQLVNVIIMLLIASAIASWIVNGTGPDSDKWNSYVEGTAIMIIVILNAGIAAYTENDANNALEALSKMSQPMARVRRNGQDREVKCVEVVRGDVVILQTGDIAPADLRLIESSELKVNEMLLTGEPDDVAKSSKVKEP